MVARSADFKPTLRNWAPSPGPIVWAVSLVTMPCGCGQKPASGAAADAGSGPGRGTLGSDADQGGNNAGKPAVQDAEMPATDATLPDLPPLDTLPDSVAIPQQPDAPQLQDLKALPDAVTVDLVVDAEPKGIDFDGLLFADDASETDAWPIGAPKVGDVVGVDIGACSMNPPKPAACTPAPNPQVSCPAVPQKIPPWQPCKAGLCVNGITDADGKCVPKAVSVAGTPCGPEGPSACVRHVCDSAGKCTQVLAPKGAMCPDPDWCGDHQCDGNGNCKAVQAKIGAKCKNTKCATWFCNAAGDCADVQLRPKGELCGYDYEKCRGFSCNGGGDCLPDQPIAGAQCSSFGKCACDGQCILPPPTPCKNPGTWCSVSGDNCGGGVCQPDLTCKLTMPVGAPCKSAEPCASYKCGPNGSCVKESAAVGTGCGTATGCTFGTCDCNGQCVTQVMPVGSPCPDFDNNGCMKPNSGTCQVGGACVGVVAVGEACKTSCGTGKCDLSGRCIMDGISPGQTKTYQDQKCYFSTCNHTGDVFGKELDGNKCESYGECVQGKCAGGLCEQVPMAAGTPCTPPSGDCVAGAACDGKGKCKPKGAVGKACKVSDCVLGTCTAAAKCDAGPAPDGTPCTDPPQGACKKQGACKSGWCTVKPEDSCDDGNSCTFDTCAPGGCKHDSNVFGQCLDPAECSYWSCFMGNCKVSPSFGSPCDIDNLCVYDAKCVNFLCSSSPKDCNDDDPCTIDSCDPKADLGCVHKPVADGTKCGWGVGESTCQCGLCMWK